MAAGTLKSVITSTEIDDTTGNCALGHVAVYPKSLSVAWRTSEALWSAYPSVFPSWTVFELGSFSKNRFK